MSLADPEDLFIAREGARILEKDGLRTAAKCIRACADSAELASELLAACKAQHHAIDLLFAALIELTHDHTPDAMFLPSKSGRPWDAMVAGNAAIEKAEGRSA